MKTVLLSISLLAGTFAFSQRTGFSRTSGMPPGTRFAGVVADENKDAMRSGNIQENVQFGGDVIIKNDPAADQRSVKVATAFNGWIYAGFTTQNAGNGGITIRRSTDGGVNWTDFMSFSSAGLVYPQIDLAVAGNDTMNLHLYIAGILNYNSSNVAWVDKYNATTGAYVGEYFNENLPSSGGWMYDIAIATDYMNPSVISSPYSVAVVYSKYTPVQDSLIYAASFDGGNTYTARMGALGTGFFLRHVSICYGRSAIYSNGRYFIAYELREASGADVGHIGFIHTYTDPSSTFSNPVYVDSSNTSLMNKLRNPQIAAQNDGTNNDSSALSSMITFDRQYSSTDWDALSVYSAATVYSTVSNWHRLDIDNSSISAAIQPDVIFEPGVQKYAVSYYDSTASALLLFSTGYNVNASSSWTILSAQYNDATNNLKAAHPQIAWNPNTTSAVCAWNAEGVSTNGVSMFDAEVVSTNVDQLIAAADFVSPYPNPSSGITTFEFNLKEQRDVQLHVTNMMGQEVMAPVDMGSLLPGNYTLPVDFSALSNGTYIYTMQVGNEQTSGRIVVAHR